MMVGNLRPSYLLELDCWSEFILRLKINLHSQWNLKKLNLRWLQILYLNRMAADCSLILGGNTAELDLDYPPRRNPMHQIQSGM